MNKEAFVYCWTDHFRNMLYVGYHKGNVDDGYICSSKLMREQYKLRPQDFSRQIIAQGTKEDMVKFETKILVSIDARADVSCYNRHNSNGRWEDHKHSDETKEKISKKGKGRIFTEEHKRKISEANKGKPKSEESRKLMSESQKGRKDSEETRRKKSLASTNISDERRMKYSIAQQGRKHTEESKRKISIGNLGNNNGSGKRSKETCKRISEARIGEVHSEERKRRNSESNKNSIKFECPHCGKKCSGGNANRWHFDNCKNKMKEAA